MDRRTLLAVGLVALVLFIYTVAFNHTPPQPTPEETVATDERTEPNRTGSKPATEPSIPSDGPARITGTPTFDNALTEAPGTRANLQTESVRASFTPQGGALASWTLPAYFDWQDQPVQLVSHDQLGLFRVGIVGPTGEIELSDAVFAGGSSAGAVRYVAQSEEGWRIEIRYDLRDNGYSGDVDVRVSGVDNREGDKKLVLTFPDAPVRIEHNERLDRDARASVAFVGDRFVKHNHRGKKAGWHDRSEGAIQWFGVRSKYFLAALVPDQPRAGEVLMVREGADGVATAARFPIDRDGSVDLGFTLYGGPMEYDRLSGYGVGLERAVDLGWNWIRPFSRVLLKTLNLLHGVVPNYGVVIIILSIVTKVLFYPLTKKSMESMKGIQLIKPEIERINQMHKDDAQRKNQAMLELYKKHKINPMGGCLPIVIQMPVFIGLYNVLSSSIDLRNAPFVLWINDLSSPDSIGTLLGFPLHVLPVLMAATMFFQQKLTPTDPRQAMIGYIMPVMMLVFFYQLPSGLVLYWTVNNALQVGQQALMNREAKQELKAA